MPPQARALLKLFRAGSFCTANGAEPGAQRYELKTRLATQTRFLQALGGIPAPFLQALGGILTTMTHNVPHILGDRGCRSPDIRMQGLRNSFAPVSTNFSAIETAETLSPKSPKEFVLLRPAPVVPAPRRKAQKRKLERGKLTRALEREIQERASGLDDSIDSIDSTDVSDSAIYRCISLAGCCSTFDRRPESRNQASISLNKLLLRP
jgi:hypothetical protein